MTQYDQRVNVGGTAQTTTSSYFKINLTKLPIIRQYPIVMSPPYIGQSFFFSGSVSFAAASGFGTYITSASHTLTGVITGSILGVTGSTAPVYIGGTEGNISAGGLFMESTYVPAFGFDVAYIGTFSTQAGIQYFVGNISGSANVMSFQSVFVSSGSIFDEFKIKTTGVLFGSQGPGVVYRYSASLENYPYNAVPLDGYFRTHHKYRSCLFNYDEITSGDATSGWFKWKRGSQNKKTTIDPSTGLLNNSEPVETKTV
jgi:hypothetical protein